MTLINMPMIQCDYQRCQKLFTDKEDGWINIEDGVDGFLAKIVVNIKKKRHSFEIGRHYCSMDCFIKDLRSQLKDMS